MRYEDGYWLRLADQLVAIHKQDRRAKLKYLTDILLMLYCIGLLGGIAHNLYPAKSFWQWCLIVVAINHCWDKITNPFR